MNIFAQIFDFFSSIFAGSPPAQNSGGVLPPQPLTASSAAVPQIPTQENFIEQLAASFIDELSIFAPRTSIAPANISPDMDAVARTIWGEARGEGEAGMTAVANVIFNRWIDAVEGVVTWWGSTFKEICHAPYQFSAWNSNDPNRAKMLAVTDADPQFRIALGLAQKCTNGTLADLTGGATSYYDTSITAPSWAASMTRTAQIGRLIFYA